LAVENADGVRVAGVLSEDERSTWEAVYKLGAANADDVAIATGADSVRVRGTLDSLCGRRLVMRANDEYVAIGHLPACQGRQRNAGPAAQSPATRRDAKGRPGSRPDGDDESRRRAQPTADQRRARLGLWPTPR